MTTSQAENYQLVISQREVQFADSRAKKFAINDSYTGPTLHFTEGEEAVIIVRNELKEPTAIHWHGILLPGFMDGVPGLNGFKGISPGETFEYRFPLRQSGTYWYHSHALGQEQDGIYGAIVIHPKIKDSNQSDRDYVLLLSEFSEESWQEILGNLKRDASYYNRAQTTLGDFLSTWNSDGFFSAFRSASDWGAMRMSKSDLSDVSGYTFLVNGKSPEQNWTGLFTPGETIRLRVINASAMSIYDFSIPGLKMKIIQADGQNVEPFEVDEFRFGVAETYDLLVTPAEEKAYSIVAEPIDRTGFGVGTLAPRAGMRGEIPPHRKRASLTMADMGHMHGMSHEGHAMMDMESGWNDRGAASGAKVLSYEDLRSSEVHPVLPEPTKTIQLTLDGNMERYIWTLNGKKHEDSTPIRVSYGEVVRLNFKNDSMMAHPMHLHGMFVFAENGQPRDRRPKKHTLIIPPGTSRSVLLRADEPGEWAFHCHLLYHMLSGMMTTLIVESDAHPAKAYSHAH